MAKSYRIHPAIGIARVGNATRGNTENDGWFIGPETPGVPANWDFATKRSREFKKAGAVKAQAARFRIWEYEDQGGKLVPIKEIDLEDARVKSLEWSLTLANKKAGFFEIKGQDGAETLWQDGPNSHSKRNGGVQGVNRLQLTLGPVQATISGASKPRVPLSVDKPGLTKIEMLGEVATDSAGRLLAFGAKGLSESPTNQPITEFANNDGWFDDIADGPVSARLTLRDSAGNDQVVSVEGAWLLVGPPDFGPSIPPYVSLFDTVLDTVVRRMQLPASWPDGYVRRIHELWNTSGGFLDNHKPSYLQEIFPMIYAGHQVSWVHREITESQTGHTPIRPEVWAALGRATVEPPPPGSAPRRRVFNQLRNPDSTSMQEKAMPRSFGDFYDTSQPNKYLSFTRLQYTILKRWKDGQFTEDFPNPPPATADLPIKPAQPELSPEGLDRAALENSAGGGFFPGIEASWLMRDPRVYSAPFRVAVGRNLGATAIGDLIIEAGFFSQQMALPWQADFLLCKKEFNGDLAFAWWPTQRPDDVRREGDDPTDVMLEWARDINNFDDMVRDWPTRGFVVQRGDRHVEVEGPDGGVIA